MKNSFDLLFNKYKKKIKTISINFSKKYGVPSKEIESQLNEEFFLKTPKYDENRNNNYNSYILSMLRQRALRVVQRKEGHYYRNVSLYEDELGTKESGNENGDSETRVFENVYKHHTEKDFIEQEVVKKSDGDQRQLISHLAESVKTDPVATAIVTEWLKMDKPTPTAIGRKLGLHHYTVTRKLKKLARNYDERQFGNYRDYLNVG